MKVRIKEIDDRHDYSYVTNKGFVIGHVYEIHEDGFDEEDKGVVIIDGDKRCFLYEWEYEVVEV